MPILQGEGAHIRVCNPQGRRHGETLLKGVTWCANALEAAHGADIVLVLTEWNEFRAIDLTALKRAMKGNLLIDTRNVFAPADARQAGLRYLGIGRPDGGVMAEERASPKLLQALGVGVSDADLTSEPDQLQA